VEDLGLRSPSLDDVFLTLTGTGEEPPVSEPRAGGPQGNPGESRRAAA
jgi:hypothetical protein